MGFALSFARGGVMIGKILIVGGEGVGKCAFEMMVNHNSSAYIEPERRYYCDSYRKQLTVDEETDMLEIMSFLEPQQYSDMLKWGEPNQGFLCVYSITSRTSFEDLATFYLEARTENSAHYPMVLVGN